MRLKTLGGLALESATLRRPKPLLLLAYLAVEGSKEKRHLQKLFWPEAEDPAVNLRMTLSRLREAGRGLVKADERTLGTTLQSDVTVLETALRNHNIEKILELYQGEFLAGFSLPDWGAELEDWVYSTREFIAAQVRSALIRQAEVVARGGKFAEAADWAEKAYRVGGSPEPEDLERLYLLLLAGDHPLGGELRKHAKEYGLELSQSAAAARVRFFSLSIDTPTALGIPHNLPTPKTSFVGRDPERIEIGGLLERQEVRLLTLLGPGGIGKTRLALQIAHDQLQGNRFLGGLYWVGLENLASEDQIPRAIAEALGIKLSNNTDPLEAVADLINTGVVLMVLDNFEHLMGGVLLVPLLLERCPNLTFLVTSRERLQLEEEFVLSLGGLSRSGASNPTEAELNDAVQLFLQRARRVRLDYRLEQADWPFVLEICEQLEGSPLGIELAAAWIRGLPPKEIALEIRRNFDILQTSTRNTKQGHQSLRAVFDHSWNLLSSAEQEVFARLAVFEGGFSRMAAAEVAGATIPVLASLVDKSLLRVDGEGRYDQHALLRQYALEQLASQPEALEQTRQRQCEFFIALSQQADAEIHGPQQADWLERLEQERPNLLVTLNWAIEQRKGVEFVRLTQAIRHVWMYRGYATEGNAWLLKGLKEAAIPEGSSFMANALSDLGLMQEKLGNLAESGTFHQRSLAIWQSLGQKSRIAVELNNLAINARKEGRPETALAYIEQSLEIIRELGDQRMVANSLANLATAKLELGHYARARAATEESLELQRNMGDTVLVANTLLNLGEMLTMEGDFATARTRLEEALSIQTRLGNRSGIAYALINLGDVAQKQSDFTSAAASYQQSLTHLQELNDLYAIPFVLEGLAGTAHPARAAYLWGVAETLRANTHNPMPSYNKAAFETQVSAARRTLGDEAFQEAWAQGQSASLEGAISVALEPIHQTSGPTDQFHSKIS